MDYPVTEKLEINNEALFCEITVTRFSTTRMVTYTSPPDM